MLVRQTAAANSTLIFFGSLDRWSHRSTCWKYLQASPLMAWPPGGRAPAWAVTDHGGRGENQPLVGGGEESRLVSLYDVWTDEAFARFAQMPGVGVFLIIKKGCNPKGPSPPARTPAAQRQQHSPAMPLL